MLLGAPYYDDEYTTKKLLTILGDIDQYDEMMRRKAAEDIDRLDMAADETEEEPEDGET